MNWLGGATFDLFFWSCWCICQVLMLRGWAVEDDAQCHTQKVFADPCSMGPCWQDLLLVLPHQDGCQGSGPKSFFGLPCLRSHEQD